MAAISREMEEKRTGAVTSQQHVRLAARESRLSLDAGSVQHIPSTIRRHSMWTGKRRMSRKTAEQILVSKFVHQFLYLEISVITFIIIIICNVELCPSQSLTKLCENLNPELYECNTSCINGYINLRFSVLCIYSGV